MVRLTVVRLTVVRLTVARCRVATCTVVRFYVAAIVCRSYSIFGIKGTQEQIVMGENGRKIKIQSEDEVASVSEAHDANCEQNEGACSLDREASGSFSDEGSSDSESDSVSEEPLDDVRMARSGRDADFSVFENDSSGSSGREQELEAELRDAKERYLRALADLDNVKKRTAKERSDLLKYQGERIFLDLLEVVDNFDRAMENVEADSDTLREGVALIHRMLKQVLVKWDVQGESAVGKKFDPTQHEAISQMPSAEAEPGTIVNELEKPYFYKDKLIRPGKVVVSVAAPGAAEASAGSE
ncbi:MAG: nucleotide exchange factor GrpE [Bdellovibrionales bacterium]|nr:nucleotide exchange factor GrpE [Bdellovibrionales bacterium]